MADAGPTETLDLPLAGLHAALGAKLGPFAGYAMPLQYGEGVMAEHLWTRSEAGLFDVSHMGQVRLPLAALEALEGLIPADLLGLTEGRQRYGLFTNEVGGVLDDLMVARRAGDVFVVVNAACKPGDIAHLNAHIDGVEVVEDRALLALQGPKAEAALASLVPATANMRFMDVAVMRWEGGDLWISRSGYSGEDGYEVSLPLAAAEPFAQKLLEHEAVKPIGLGARDSLRLEAGLPLYGQDLGPDISPVEAGQAWSIGKVRRSGGPRAGGFPGSDVVLGQIAEGAPRRRVGLRPEGRAPMRAGVELFASETDDSPVGIITSGGFGPSIAGPIALGLIDNSVAESARLFGALRGKRLPVAQSPVPFRSPTYKR